MGRGDRRNSPKMKRTKNRNKKRKRLSLRIKAARR